ncbi:MAG: hypothetical protein ACYSWQ_24920, partial [Planctomycetota bacterium]
RIDENATLLRFSRLSMSLPPLNTKNNLFTKNSENGDCGICAPRGRSKAPVKFAAFGVVTSEMFV